MRPLPLSPGASPSTSPTKHPGRLRTVGCRTSGFLTSVAALVLATAPVLAEDHDHGAGHSASPATRPAERKAPLFDDLGSHQYPITTRSELAQRYFNQGLILSYAFNHPEAARAFEEAARLDPDCAMAHWGLALVLGPNINAPMQESANAKAYDALRKARERLGGATEKERALVGALSKRYAEKPEKDRSRLDAAYADAMREVAGRFPEDADVLTLFAESLMDTMAWDYWTKDLKPKPATREVLAALEKAMALSPNHPGANHLYIHAVEAGPHPEQGLTAAERLEDLCPGAGHLVHMPSHIYVRVGRYTDATVANQRAAAADESYITQCKAQGFYPANYYPHNLHFLWFTTSMEGRSREAIDAAKKVTEHINHAESGEADRLRPLPTQVLVRFGKWDEILRQPIPPADQTFSLAVSRYARGLALAARGKFDEAAAEKEALSKLVATEEAEELEQPTFPGHRLTKIAERELAAELARRKGDHGEAIRQLRSAVAIQDDLPYMEPPYWHYPVRQGLGLVLLEAGKPAEAEAVYRRDLKDNPHNGWSLFGLLQSLRAQGKTTEAEEAERRFQKAWGLADVTLTASRL